MTLPAHVRVLPDDVETARPEDAARAGRASMTAMPGAASAVDRVPGSSWTGRALALALLGATLAALAWGATQVYFVVTDAWIAPAHLTPSNEAVAQLRLAHQRQLADLARVDADVARLDGELEAIEGAIARLTALRGGAQATLDWQAELRRVEVKTAAETTALLERQRGLLGELRTRQAAIVARARTDLAAGMIDRAALEREEQARDQLALEEATLARQLADVRAAATHSQVALRALRASAGGGPTPGVGTMPEVAASDEHAVRLEIEIQRLEAEARGRRAQRQAAVVAVAAARTLLAELEARPLYRAMTRVTDVAFVPYDQLAGVRPGGRVVACTWGVFACNQVGRIAELLPGEVAMQDPWGELARGQYAILDLTSPAAIQRRVLRVRE